MNRIKNELRKMILPKNTSVFEQFEPAIPLNKVEVVRNMEHWGSQQAQKLQACAQGLVNSLKLIERGYIVESGADNEKQHAGKKIFREQIHIKEKDIESNNGRIETIRETVNPRLNNEIENKNKEINSLNVNKEQSVLSSNYIPVKNYLLASLVIIIGVYLLMFYASAINAALFTNMGAKLQGVSINNLDALFVSVFDTEVFTDWSAKSIFIYTAAFLFIGLGFLPHLTDSLIKKIVFYLFPLSVDAMLAYRIECNIYESKVLTGMASPDANMMEHLTSVNFWLVISLGYVAYIVWGQLWEAWNKENQKKDAGKMSFIQIHSLKKQIKGHEEKIYQNNLEIDKLKNQINQLHKEIEDLNKQLNYVVYSRNDLQRKLSIFMDGWLKYVSADENLVHLLEENEAAYYNFLNTINLN